MPGNPANLLRWLLRALKEQTGCVICEVKKAISSQYTL
jgi:hypothetical protein